MPDHCAAVGCSNARGVRTKEQGITFHRFPKDKVKRKAWAAAMRRRGFVPNDCSVICSGHFKIEDFDMTGQTTRIKEGAIPSVFVFSDRLRKASEPSKPRTTRTSQKAAVPTPNVASVHVQPSKDLEDSSSDHLYALDPVKVKKKLFEAQERVEELQRNLRNAKDRERRHKRMLKFLLKNLKDKNMLTAELQQELALYSDPPV